MIVFQNESLVPIEAFTTFGINAKPNTDNPIGYFGTGLKYAVAVTLRLGGKFRLFRGTEEYEFYTKELDFRGKEFTTIRMKRRKGLMSKWQYSQLPFTTELGKNWKPWMAVRELESNTRDENGMSRLVDNDHRDTIADGHTYIMIECPELEEAYENLGNIFLMDVEDPIIDNGIVQVYERPSKYIFYRGLRVRDLDKESLYTYNILSGFQLTEDRTDAYQWQTNQAILKVLVESDMSELHDKVLESDDTSFESTLDFDHLWTTPSGAWLGNVERRVRGNLPILSRAASYYNNKFREPSPDDVFSVEFTRAELEAIIDSVVDDDIASKCKEAIEDN